MQLVSRLLLLPAAVLASSAPSASPVNAAEFDHSSVTVAAMRDASDQLRQLFAGVVTAVAAAGPVPLTSGAVSGGIEVATATFCLQVRRIASPRCLCNFC